MVVSFEELPNEVLYNIFLCVPPSTVPLLQQVSRRFNGVSQPLLWRHHCRTLFKYWSPERRMQEKFNGDVNKVDWKQIFSERYNLSRQVDHGINDILSEQKCRLPKAQNILSAGYDAKDALLRNLNVGDSAEDVLARRYYSDTLLGLVHRNMAIQEWVKLSEGHDVPLEKALAGFDMFVLHGRGCDFDEISALLDSIAQRFRQDMQDHAGMDTRSIATALVEFLRFHDLVGIKGNIDEDYHNMQNNFIGIALEDPKHPSLPLISVAIYCCVAQRLGLDAQPCGFPFHVLAIIKPPKGLTVAGHELPDGHIGDPMYMDPFRTSKETHIDDLRSQLVALGIANDEHAAYLGSSSTAEIVRRSAKNIITSVQTLPRNDRMNHLSIVECFPEMDGAFYSSLWALTILAEGDRQTATTQRAQFLPYITQRVEGHFPMDVPLIAKYIMPLFRSPTQQNQLLNTITAMRASDAANREVRARTSENAGSVRFKIGQHFQHKRYSYFAVITGWDVECLAGDAWISRMGVSQLSRGRHQSFYHVRVEDGSPRYVAEDNIKVVDHEPSQGLMRLAGQYFKRWDQVSKSFVSNIKDEYPDD